MRVRTRARELALQFLFQMDFHDDFYLGEFEAFADEELGEHKDADEVKRYARRVVEGVLRNREQLDAVLDGAVHNWELTRMAGIDRNALRIGCYELLHEQGVPMRVAINEAIELAKKFSTEASGAFVNGIPGPHPQGSRSELEDTMGLFDKLKRGLAKTRDGLTGGLKTVLTLGRAVDDNLLEEVEETLLLSDVGPVTTKALMEAARSSAKRGSIKTAEDLQALLQEQIAERLRMGGTALGRADEGPTVVLVCGVNGSGKTTSIGKLTRYLSQQGHKVVLGAADTFRAAAVEQLTIWSERNGVDIVKQATGAKPDAVAFDACKAGLARDADFVIIDTAGRLHTQKDLMAELDKIRRVIGKAIPGAPHEVLLVLDATTGQNALRQADLFNEVANVTGLFVTKLDGTAKGGAVIAVRDTIGVPVKFVGLGEQIDDIEPFDPDVFAKALFD